MTNRVWREENGEFLEPILSMESLGASYAWLYASPKTRTLWFLQERTNKFEKMNRGTAGRWKESEPPEKLRMQILLGL